MITLAAVTVALIATQGEAQAGHGGHGGGGYASTAHFNASFGGPGRMAFSHPMGNLNGFVNHSTDFTTTRFGNPGILNAKINSFHTGQIHTTTHLNKTIGTQGVVFPKAGHFRNFSTKLYSERWRPYFSHYYGCNLFFDPFYNWYYCWYRPWGCYVVCDYYP
jgi:hypothetical protein